MFLRHWFFKARALARALKTNGCRPPQLRVTVKKTNEKDCLLFSRIRKKQQSVRRFFLDGHPQLWTVTRCRKVVATSRSRPSLPDENWMLLATAARAVNGPCLQDQ
jgi:hypothetical protein